jgi:hypothetical protein
MPRGSRAAACSPYRLDRGFATQTVRKVNFKTILSIIRALNSLPKGMWKPPPSLRGLKHEPMYYSFFLPRRRLHFCETCSLRAKARLLCRSPAQLPIRVEVTNQAASIATSVQQDRQVMVSVRILWVNCESVSIPDGLLRV